MLSGARLDTDNNNPNAEKRKKKGVGRFHLRLVRPRERFMEAGTIGNARGRSSRLYALHSPEGASHSSNMGFGTPRETAFFAVSVAPAMVTGAASATEANRRSSMFRSTASYGFEQ